VAETLLEVAQTLSQRTLAQQHQLLLVTLVETEQQIPEQVVVVQEQAQPHRTTAVMAVQV
jgi:hypothetical protein